MKIKLFEDFNKNLSEKDIEEYLGKKYTPDWFNSELSERASDFLDEEDVKDFDGDYEEAYRNFAMGGAIEYDLIDEMIRDVKSTFKINPDDIIEERDLYEICTDHMIDHCDWYDRFLFKKSGTEDKNIFGIWE